MALKRNPLTPVEVQKLRDDLAETSRRTRRREELRDRVAEMAARRRSSRLRTVAVVTSSGMRMYLREAGTNSAGEQLWAQVRVDASEPGPWLGRAARA